MAGPQISNGDPVPTHPKHVWLQRCGIRLMTLQPHLNAVAAAKLAVDAFRDWADLDPAAAAERLDLDGKRDDDDSA